MHKTKMFIRKKVGFLVAPQVYETLMSYPKENVNSAFIRCGWLNVEDIAGITHTTPAEVEAAVGSLEETHKFLNAKGLVRLHKAHDFSGQQHRSDKWTINVSPGLGNRLSAYDSGEEECEQTMKDRDDVTQQRLSAKIRSSKGSIGKFLADNARRAAAAGKAKTAGDKAQKAGGNLCAKKVGLPPPQQAPETSAAASSSSGAAQAPKKRPLSPPQQAPETSAVASSSNGAEEAPKKRSRGSCTPATVVQEGFFIDCMGRILKSKHTATTTNANLLKEALAGSYASLRLQWTRAVLAPDFNDSFGEFLYSHVRQTMNLLATQKVDFGISLIQQQLERTSGPVV